MPKACAHCGKDNAAMQCPKCKELGLPPALFCKQACFKAAWAEHKAVHANAPPSIKTMTDAERAEFAFTGDVRPGLITAGREVPAAIPRPDYMAHPEGVSRLEEQSYGANKMFQWRGRDIAGIRAIAKHTRDILDIGLAHARPGMATDEIDRVIHEAAIERGLYPSPLGYNRFPKSVCTSVNEVICHGIPDSRVLQEGETLNIDVSVYGCGGYHGDANETMFIGKPKPESVKLLTAAYESMCAGFATCRPGALYKHIGDAVAQRAKADQYETVRSICGHGIGKLFHCAPVVPHYAGSKAAGVMKAGHVFTIEPMVVEGTWEDELWPDDWTIVTKDGKRSAMFEQMCLVTDKGYEWLTAGPGYEPHFMKQLREWGMTDVPAPDAAAPGPWAKPAVAPTPPAVAAAAVADPDAAVGAA